MKNLIILFTILSLAITGINAQERCDTLKLKVTESAYCKPAADGSYDKIGNLEGAVINIDTLSVFYPGLEIVNVSNDTFPPDGEFNIIVDILSYTDTGIVSTPWSYVLCDFDEKFIPNDTLRIGINLKCDLTGLVNSLKDINVDFEKLTHWQMIMAINYTDKDGFYTDSVIFAGADTATFYVVRTPLGIQHMENNQSAISVFPNPAQTQFTVTNTENATIWLYNMQGQQVLQTAGKGDNTVIYTENLPAGVYVLKMEKANAVHTRKVQIVR